MFSGVWRLCWEDPCKESKGCSMEVFSGEVAAYGLTSLRGSPLRGSWVLSPQHKNWVIPLRTLQTTGANRVSEHTNQVMT